MTYQGKAIASVSSTPRIQGKSRQIVRKLPDTKAQIPHGSPVNTTPTGPLASNAMPKPINNSQRSDPRRARSPCKPFQKPRIANVVPTTRAMSIITMPEAKKNMTEPSSSAIA